ncbi:hypothetical protein EVAR_51156_1 [Eumeta japonica]|uniref:Mos1 transposase HTH domain-containing protein n=1 Tax=Eumeta variegata TaxID=151549 RepID=A0A4C1XF00_EUMVA|nr:hypothetical protein EVAR_51156_1 [Eumeta japonica]
MKFPYWQDTIVNNSLKTAWKICEIEGEDKVNKRTSQRWFNRFNGGALTPADHSRYGRPPLWYTEATEKEIIACLCLDLLLVDLGMSISFVTVVIPEVLNAKEGLSINEYQASWFGG